MYGRTVPVWNQRNKASSIRVFHLAIPRELSTCEAACTSHTRTQAMGMLGGQVNTTSFLYSPNARENGVAEDGASDVDRRTSRQNALRFYRSSVVVTKFEKSEVPFASSNATSSARSELAKYFGPVPSALVEVASARYREKRREKGDCKKGRGETCEKEGHVCSNGHNCGGGCEKTSGLSADRTAQWCSAEGDVGKDSRLSAETPKIVDDAVVNSSMRSFIASRVAIREALHEALGIGQWSSCSTGDSANPDAYPYPATCRSAVSRRRVYIPASDDHPLLETDKEAFNWSQLQTYKTMKQAFCSLPVCAGFSLAHEESLSAAVTIVGENHFLKAGGEEELGIHSTAACKGGNDGRSNRNAIIINGASEGDVAADESVIKPSGLHVRVGIDIVNVSRVRSLVVRQPRFVRRWLPHLLPILKSSNASLSESTKENASPSNFSDTDMFLIAAHWGLRECLVKIFEENKAVLMGDCCSFYSTQTNHLYSAPSCSPTLTKNCSSPSRGEPAANSPDTIPGDAVLTNLRGLSATTTTTTRVNLVALAHTDQHAVFKGCTANRLAGLGLSPTIRFFTHIVDGHTVVTAFAFPMRKIFSEEEEESVLLLKRELPKFVVPS